MNKPRSNATLVCRSLSPNDKLKLLEILHSNPLHMADNFGSGSMMNRPVEGETIVMDGWQVVAVLGEGTYVTDGEYAYQVGSHSEDESSPKQLEKEYARLYNNHGGD